MNAFLREERRLGIIQLLEQAATEDDPNVRILGPTNDTIENRLKDITVREGKEGGEKRRRNFDFRSINTPFEGFAVSTGTIVVIDKKESRVFEKVDDSKGKFYRGLRFSHLLKQQTDCYVIYFSQAFTIYYYQINAKMNGLELYQNIRKKRQRKREWRS